MASRSKTKTKTGKSTTREKKTKKNATTTDGENDIKTLLLATNELVKQQRLRNYYQLERERLIAFWDITKKEIEAVKAQQRLAQRELEDVKERHDVDLKAMKAKLRHAMFEHKAELDGVRIETERLLRDKADEHRADDAAVQDTRRVLAREERELELLHDARLHRMRTMFDAELSAQLQSSERQLKELQLQFERRSKALRDALDAHRKRAVAETEQRKAAHVQALMAEHDVAFREIKEYYVDITSHNLELIKTLKEQVFEMKRNEAFNERLMFEVAVQNRKLTDPLTAALKEVSVLTHALADYERDKQALRAAKATLGQVEAHHRALQWRHEVLRQRHEHLESEVEAVQNRFEAALAELQQKATFRTVLLRRKMGVVAAAVEAKSGELAELLASSNVPRETLAPVQAQVDAMLAAKDNTVGLLTDQIRALAEQHDNVVARYEEYLKANGVTGLRPS
eukprot:TRINITY_DN57025_c0_g1_i1.p1 TRINITY_DN57025_c0_g1~~TRINITY_DN57025_c0_g1_i1.p1  ORF type:complete len:456 (-),score=127.98 TRINITY_DN57025_c0_g1_i1:132-1499(-)